MTTTTTLAPASLTHTQSQALYENVLDYQDNLITRGDLHPTYAHQIAFGKFLPNGETHIECTCGRGMFRPDDQAQAAFALHVADALQLKIRMGRAA